MSHFHPLEVVGRDSETQLQVGENLIQITWLGMGQLFVVSRYITLFTLKG